MLKLGEYSVAGYYSKSKHEIIKGLSQMLHGISPVISLSYSVLSLAPIL